MPSPWQSILIRISTLTISALIILLAQASIAWAGSDPGNTPSPSPIILEWSYLKDSSGSLRFEDVHALPPERFSPLPSGLFTAGYTRASFWIRFTILAPAAAWCLDVLPPYLDSLQLYRADSSSDGPPTLQSGGDHLPYQQREIPYRGFAFKMEPTGSSPETFYLRVHTTSAYHLVVRAWSETAFLAQSSFEAAAGFSALAILLTFLILNVNHLLWSKSSVQAWLCAYLASLILAYTSILGFTAQFVTPDKHPEWNDLWVGLANMAAMTTGSGFHRRFFSIDARQSFILLLYRVGCWLPAVGVVAVFLGYYPEIMPLLFAFYFVLSLVGLVLALRLLKRHEPGGLLASLAVSSGLAGIMIVILNLEGLLLGGLTLLYSMIICSIIQVALLHLAVGRKYQQLEFEKIQEADKALRAQEDASRERTARMEQSDLFAMISHEIRTPLTMISGAVQSLEALVDASPDINRRHDRIRKAVWRIDSLVTKTLDYDLSECELENADAVGHHDLRRVADHVVRQYELQDGHITVFPDEHPCMIRGHLRLLEILLSNLIDNAIKYGAASPICVQVTSQGQYARIDVRDGGPGVPHEQIPTLFNRYSRGKHLGDIPGTGLGLYLVVRIARWHGGEVLYERVERGGACFIVLLPREPSLPENMPEGIR